MSLAAGKKLGRYEIRSKLDEGWRRVGKELFYILPDWKVMAVDVKVDGSTFESSAPLGRL